MVTVTRVQGSLRSCLIDTSKYTVRKTTVRKTTVRKLNWDQDRLGPHEICKQVRCLPYIADGNLSGLNAKLRYIL